METFPIYNCCRDIFHSIECRFPLPCFRGRLWFPPLVGLLLFVDVAAGQSLAAILFNSSQSQGDAIEEPCRPSKAAPTHLLAIVNFDREIIVFTSDHTKSPGLPWLGDPMKKSQCQSALWNHSHMGHLQKAIQEILFLYLQFVLHVAGWTEVE